MLSHLLPVLNVVLMAVATLGVAALTKLLLSPGMANFVNASATRLAAETNKLVAEADTTNNVLLISAIHAAMVYAEAHQAEVLKEFDSKADYVENVIDADPRFAHLNLPLDAIKHLIEQLYQAYFSALPHTAPAAPAPADVTGGGPTGKPADITGGGPTGH